MGANTKSLRLRIRSVDSTLHLTKAMGLVASSKMRRAMDAMLKSREYTKSLRKIIDLVSTNPECQKSPFMQVRNGDRTKLLVIAGDRGLAGGYNVNVFRTAKEYPDAEIIPIGKRACDKYGDGFISSEHFSAEDSDKLVKTLCEQFVAGEYDRLGIVSTQYHSLISQEPTVTWVLPLQKTKAETRTGMIFEPNEYEILNSAVPFYISGILYAAVRESFACEIAARRTAMDSAGKNAQQMIDDLQLAYNRARQGAITQEITEIVAGSGGQ